MGENMELQQLVDEDSGEAQLIPDHTTLKPHQHQRQNHRQNQHEPPKKWPYLGLILATLSSLFFSLCSVIVKFMTDVDPMALAAYRYVGVLLPAIPIVILKREQLFPKGKRVMLLLRSFTGTTALMLSFYAFRHMPLADASVIVFSVPVFTGIFARIFLREPCGKFGAFTVLLTLIGVVLITRPALLFQDRVHALGALDLETSTLEYEKGTSTSNSRDGLSESSSSSASLTGDSSYWGAVAALSATLFGACAYVILRALRGTHFAVIMTNFGVFALVQCATVAGAVGGLCAPPCGTDRYLIVALALFSFLGQILLTVALKIEQAGPVAIARSSDIVFAFAWQVLFFGESPNRYSIGGAVLVLSSVLLTGLRKWVMALPSDAPLTRALGCLVK